MTCKKVLFSIIFIIALIGVLFGCNKKDTTTTAITTVSSTTKKITTSTATTSATTNSPGLTQGGILSDTQYSYGTIHWG